MAYLEICLKKSMIGSPRWMRVVLRTLGLRRLHQRVVHRDNGAIRGQVRLVSHLVSVREVSEPKG